MKFQKNTHFRNVTIYSGRANTRCKIFIPARQSLVCTELLQTTFPEPVSQQNILPSEVTDRLSLRPQFHMFCCFRAARVDSCVHEFIMVPENPAYASDPRSLIATLQAEGEAFDAEISNCRSRVAFSDRVSHKSTVPSPAPLSNTWGA